MRATRSKPILGLAVSTMFVAAACSGSGASDETESTDSTVIVESVAEVLSGAGASEELSRCYAEVLGPEGETLESLDDLAELTAELDTESQTALQRCALDHAE